MANKKPILAVVNDLQKKLNKLSQADPSDPSIEALKAEIQTKRDTEEFKLALEAEEKRMGEELKKLFQM